MQATSVGAKLKVSELLGNDTPFGQSYLVMDKAINKAAQSVVVARQVWRDKMKSTQKPQTKQNAAWRAFWIKIRELDARESGSRKEARGDDHGEQSSANDGPAGLTTIANGKGNP